MTKETKHTPGPWKAFEQSSMVFGPDKVVVADASPADNAYRPKRESWANARLIASAPELLEALEGILSFNSLSDSNPAVIEARQAISRAKGK